MLLAGEEGATMERRKVFSAAVALAAAGAIAGAWLGGGWLPLHYACKPLATLLILWMAAVVPADDARYRRRVLAGLVCSLAGDVLLMLPGDHFVAGLVAFLLAHLCYIAAFVPGMRRRDAAWAALPLLLYAGINLAGLWPYLPPALKAPVLAYVLVLAAMAMAAIARWRGAARTSPLRGAAGSAAVGALLFVASDSLLAWDRFAGTVPAPALAVLATYFLAQWCIARSVSTGANPAR